jgi:hypothetical protein
MKSSFDSRSSPHFLHRLIFGSSTETHNILSLRIIVYFLNSLCRLLIARIPSLYTCRILTEYMRHGFDTPFVGFNNILLPRNDLIET